MIVFSFLLISSHVLSQVGINTDSAKASLDIEAIDRSLPGISDGLLIPRLDTFPASNPTVDQNGMLIFLDVDNHFYYWHNNSGSWIKLTSSIISVKKIDDLLDAKSDHDGSEDGSSIFLGIGAGEEDDQTNNRNIGIGFEALQSVIGGNRNIAIGHRALKSDDSGFTNIAIGASALESNVGKGNLIAIGDSVLFNNSLGASAGYESKGNIGIGNAALLNNTVGNKNVVIGASAMKMNISGYSNTVIGWGSLYENIAGNRNAAFGHVSLANNTIGERNTALGSYTLFSNDTGSKNTGVGHGALYHNISGSGNVAVGTGALNKNLDRSGIVAVGDSSLFHNGTSVAIPVHATENTAVGYKAGFLNSNGLSNSFFGFESGKDVSSGYGNTLVGAHSGSKLSSGFFNTFSGAFAGFSNISGYGNVAFGYRSLYYQNSGNRNIAIGYKAGENLLTGNHNIIIGDSLHVEFPDSSHQLLIGNLIEGNMKDSLIRVKGSFQIGMNSDSLASPGTIRWNSMTQDFEGFDGSSWVSLTYSKNEWDDHGTSEFSSATSANVELFGYAIDIDGIYAAIGAPLFDNEKGRVVIYKRMGSVWSSIDTIMAPDASSQSQFGYSVSLDNNKLLIGSPYKSVSGNAEQGKAYIFENSGSSWTYQHSLISSDGAAGDHFGYSLSLDDGFAAVGSPNKKFTFIGQGAAYLFGVNGSEIASFNLVNSLQGRFGTDVDVKIQIITFGQFSHLQVELLISQPNFQPVLGLFSPGRIYFFKKFWNSSSYNLQQIISPTAAISGAKFGQTFQRNDNSMIVGAPNDNISGNINQGSAFVFAFDGAQWQEENKLISNTGHSEDGFGSNVSLSGEYVIIGAKKHDTYGNIDQGIAFVFKKNDNAWNYQTRFISSDGESGNEFGHSLSIFGDDVIVSSCKMGNNKGKIYFYRK